jgi:hypothetical protein
MDAIHLASPRCIKVTLALPRFDAFYGTVDFQKVAKAAKIALRSSSYVSEGSSSGADEDIVKTVLSANILGLQPFNRAHKTGNIIHFHRATHVHCLCLDVEMQDGFILVGECMESVRLSGVWLSPPQHHNLPPWSAITSLDLADMSILAMVNLASLCEQLDTLTIRCGSFRLIELETAPSVPFPSIHTFHLLTQLPAPPCQQEVEEIARIFYLPNLLHLTWPVLPNGPAHEITLLFDRVQSLEFIVYRHEDALEYLEFVHGVNAHKSIPQVCLRSPAGIELPELLEYGLALAGSSQG